MVLIFRPEITSSNRLKGHFCLGIIFNLSHRVLSDAEIKILEKTLDFALILMKINEPELRKYFEEFCRVRIRGRSLVVTDLPSETKGSRFKSSCYLCAEVS